MNTGYARILIVAVFSLAINGCTSSPSPTPTTSVPSPVPSTLVPEPTPTPIPPTLTPEPEGMTIVVDNPADSGSGTLRQALLDAQAYDTIVFDPAVFQPDAPEAIKVESELPFIEQGHLTIDASDAGVVLDGSMLSRDSFISGLELLSEANTIRGLQIINFTGVGIAISEGGHQNTIGGDRSVGAGPSGQGNLMSANEFGIAMWGSASANTVIGNLIGTDSGGTQPQGNRDSGVWLTEGASQNVIGADNLIAYNNSGVLINGPDAIGNTITQNSIHGNSEGAIVLLNGGNTGLRAPILLDFSLQDGTVSGLACANCIIEIYSDESDGAASFEASTMADTLGAFFLDKESSFEGPRLSAVATDADGNTGYLAAHSSGPFRVATLQEGNESPRAVLLTKPPSELSGNYLGDQFDGLSLKRYPGPCPNPQEDETFTHVGDLGFTWVRLSVDRLEWWEGGDQTTSRFMGEPSSYDISPCADEIISLLAENGVTMVHPIVHWDENLHSQRLPNYRSEEEIQLYLDYVRHLVSYFKDRIEYFGILSEALFYVDLPDYINIIHRAVPIIREESPEAKIVVTGSAGLSQAENRSYLFGLLRSDVMPIIDAIEIHPMYGASPQFEGVRQYYYDYPDLVREIMEVAEAHGFVGEYFATEMTWGPPPAPNPDLAPGQEYTHLQASKYYARGITLHRGLDMWAAIGGIEYGRMPTITSVVRNLSTIMDEAEPRELELQIESEATNIANFSFSFPNGQQMIAVWTDGAAVDSDPGVLATITVRDLSPREVIGTDPLVGFEQLLNFELDNNELVIGDVLIKDYPIFIHLVP